MATKREKLIEKMKAFEDKQRADALKMKESELKFQEAKQELENEINNEIIDVVRKSFTVYTSPEDLYNKLVNILA